MFGCWFVDYCTATSGYSHFGAANEWAPDMKLCVGCCCNVTPVEKVLVDPNN